MNKKMLLSSECKASLSLTIEKAYNALREQVCGISLSLRTIKKINGTGGLVSVNDLIAYLIGWNERLIEWYEAGLQGKMPENARRWFYAMEI